MSDTSTEQLHDELQAACNELPGKPEVRRMRRSAEEWISKNIDDLWDADGDIQQYHLVKAFEAGYSRGKAEAEKRIWEACVRDVEGDPKRPLWLHELRTFIFENGDDVLQMTLEQVELNSPIEQVGERHWRIKDGTK